MRIRKQAGDSLTSFLGGIVGFVMIAVLVGAWLTHVIVCFQQNRWGFLIAGALMFPIAIVHGIGIWLGAW